MEFDRCTTKKIASKREEKNRWSEVNEKSKRDRKTGRKRCAVLWPVARKGEYQSVCDSARSLYE